MLADENFIIQNVVTENPEIIQVVYTELNEMHQGGNQTNVPIAAFVTTYARLKLYRTLAVLDKHVLYFDTDSIIFVSDKVFSESENYPKLGDFLGEWTDESDGREIVEFVSCGPKNYAVRYSDGFAKCVVKGIQQTCLANEVITFDAMKELVRQDKEKQLLMPQSRIRIDRANWKLTTTYSDKKYQFVYDKRVISNDFFTFPFGYQYKQMFSAFKKRQRQDRRRGSQKIEKIQKNIQTVARSSVKSLGKETPTCSEERFSAISDSGHNYGSLQHYIISNQ